MLEKLASGILTVPGLLSSQKKRRERNCAKAAMFLCIGRECGPAVERFERMVHRGKRVRICRHEPASKGRHELTFDVRDIL